MQIGVALGAQWMQRSVLDAGLAVLSYASGSVLGAFLLGTLAPSITEGRGIHRHAGRAGRDDGRLGVDDGRLHLVRVHRRSDHGGVRLAAPRWLAARPALALMNTCDARAPYRR